MNFLAHIHIAEHCDSSIAGNLLGDFVKGDPEKQYPAEIARGIRLHRYVDSYTDNHPLMREAKQYFSAELKRYAPIALDLFWDHCLARMWANYHGMTLEAFCVQAESKARNILVEVPERYTLVTDRMWRGRWLVSYREFDTLEVALQRMSQRSARMQPLAACFAPLRLEYQALSALFPSIYQDVLQASASYAGSISREIS